MIVGTMATFPARRASLIETVTSLAGQVDRLHVVLNEYTEVLPELAGFANVDQIIPPRDLKDTGKFWPDVSGADWVFTLDDDILYPDDYVVSTLEKMARFDGQRVMGGYHGSIYVPQPLKGFKLVQLRYWLHAKRGAASSREVVEFHRALAAPQVVEQLGTGVVVMRGSDWPGFAAMESSQRFVDVRLARLCFEAGIAQISLPRAAGWLKDRQPETSIFQDFTARDPRHVTREIRSFAYKVPNRGKMLT